MTMRERLDRKKRNKIWNNHHEAVLAMVIILLIAGLFNVFSSTFVMAERDCGTPYYYLKRHIISMVVEQWPAVLPPEWTTTNGGPG